MIIVVQVNSLLSENESNTELFLNPDSTAHKIQVLQHLKRVLENSARHTYSNMKGYELTRGGFLFSVGCADKASC